MNGSEGQAAAARRRVPEQPVLLVKWYDYTKWLLERVEQFPKSQRFVLGTRLADLVVEILEDVVEAAYAGRPRKVELLAKVNRRIEVARWLVRLARDRHLLSNAQLGFSSGALEECGRMVGGWLRSLASSGPTGASVARKSGRAGGAPPASVG
jgi:hypothetical protein